VDVKRLFSFDGRIGRGPYWGISTTNIVANFVGFGLISIGNGTLTVLVVLVFVALIAISLAVSVKRWHDRDKSGFWIFINLVPIIGWLWAWIEQGFLPGTDGDNRYGVPSGGSPFGGHDPNPEIARLKREAELRRRAGG
jgi:uncharacterized membrane protein YhaH (DUF805 family)